MNSRPRQQAFTRPLSETLGGHAALNQLLARLKASQARLEVVRSALPPALRAHVQAGILDEEGWNLLAANGAVAAKLRQCLPFVQQALEEQGWPMVALRVKVQGKTEA